MLNVPEIRQGDPANMAPFKLILKKPTWFGPDLLGNLEACLNMTEQTCTTVQNHMCKQNSILVKLSRQSNSHIILVDG